MTIRTYDIVICARTNAMFMMMMMNQMAGCDVYTIIYYITSNNANVTCLQLAMGRRRRRVVSEFCFLNENNFYRYTIDEFGNTAAGN